jgi:hypothetical protein
MSKCNNPECGSSCGFSGEMTYGSGRLDPYGYWQFPCRECAADFDSRKEQIKQEIRQELIAKGEFPLSVAQYLADAEWLRLSAWPRADQDVEKLVRDGVVYFQKLEEEEKDMERELELFEKF